MEVGNSGLAYTPAIKIVCNDGKLWREGLKLWYSLFSGNFEFYVMKANYGGREFRCSLYSGN